LKVPPVKAAEMRMVLVAVVFMGMVVGAWLGGSSGGSFKGGFAAKGAGVLQFLENLPDVFPGDESLDVPVVRFTGKG
jgi:hypothetical protein